MAVKTTALAPSCHFLGVAYPCYDSVLGWFDEISGCYYAVATRPAGPNDPINLSVGAYHPPGDGTYYNVECVGPSNSTVSGYTWLPSPPPGLPAPPTPGSLAARAIRLLNLAGPEIRTSPPADQEQVVGVPMWVWTSVDPSTWGTRSVTAAVPGESLTATAAAERITWNFGDGTTLVCAGPGTPYTPADNPASPSPTCGHTYTTSSDGQPGNVYQLTATTTWLVRWAGAGTSGELSVSRSSQIALRVAEAQAINQ